MKKKFHRSFDSLEGIFEFSEQIFSAGNIHPAVRFPVHFVMEELFTNMVKYNPDNDNDILLNVDTTDGAVTVRMTEFDVDAFDVTESPDVDTLAPLEERKPGGLGLHLIHKMVDSLSYEYSGRESTVIFTKEAQ